MHAGRRLLQIVLLGLPLVGTAQTLPIGEFFDEFTAEWVAGNPNTAVRTRYFSGEQQDRLERELTPETRAFELQRIELARRGLERLGGYDFTELDPTQRIAAEVLRWQLQIIVDAKPYLDYSFPLQQHSGANISLPNQFTVVHPLQTARDAENFVARLEQFDDRMREASAEAANRERLGIIPPDFILRATIAQMRRFVTPAAENPIVTTYAEKIATIADLGEDRAAELVGRVLAIVEEQVYPSWNAAIAVLEKQLPQANSAAGLARFANGADVYAYQLRQYTTTGLGAEEIHAIGLAEVARIEEQMDKLFRDVGLEDGTINERSEQLRARLAYPDTDAGREQIMSDINGILEDALVRSDKLFDQRPKAQVIAQAYPRFRWDNAAASYSAPPLDGSRPGVFQMPLRPDRLTQFTLRTTVYHETVPGHHFQIALANENAALPRFIQTRAFGGISASTEGWALYAERLAAESDWYADDIEGQLGQLYGALWRARRLVVDTGLHAMGWSRQQAIDYGLPVSEVERYVVYPGQACSYMIGQLTMIDLRDRARAALGARFSIREFHNVVLGLGSVPLTVLQAEVERYIQATLPQ